MEFLEQEEPPRPEYEAKCIYERKNPITGVNPSLSLTHTHTDFVKLHWNAQVRKTGVCFSFMETQKNTMDFEYVLNNIV